jgi:hypothetical protein
LMWPLPSHGLPRFSKGRESIERMYYRYLNRWVLACIIPILHKGMIKWQSEASISYLIDGRIWWMGAWNY